MRHHNASEHQEGQEESKGRLVSLRSSGSETRAKHTSLHGSMVVSFGFMGLNPDHDNIRQLLIVCPTKTPNSEIEFNHINIQV